MIIINFLILHLPTTVLTFGANGSEHTETFETAYNIMEKIQMAGFFIQELILSSIYIVETVQILRNSLRHGTRRIMKQLIFMNIVIIVLDLGLVGLESASLYILQVLLKSVVYSVKLKLEFAILGKLVQFVRGTKSGYVDHGAGAGFITTSTHMTREEKQMRTSEFVDLSRVGVNVSHPLFTHRHCNLLSPRRGSTRASDGLNMTLEYKIARFEHIDHILKLPLDEDSPRDSLALMHDNQV
ncbi:hypothetical protein DOTSEDRAFT_28599 [Dothistroma septosporum NZE10]|uniref:DUF7703 domain-containing protein n=1 Tax=Dothistroma septosporum (strain NZE10 / CBS 128990) TaxID=675120 RepID=M2YKQ4_DOTSN|nr:hypothetical protein DOTSEDRAFT_28599 [Dothistroma septosporum NZE10]